MRFLNKYKNITKLDRFNFPQLPLRIFKFQRPKWKRFQKQAALSKNSSLAFVNPFITKNSYKQWEKIQNYYRLGLQIKKKIMVFFDDSVSLKSIKKTVNNTKKTNNEFLLSVFFKPQFRLDILLWRLNFFSSSFSARQSINEGEVLLNGHIGSNNSFVKKGDIVSFSSLKSLSSFSLDSLLKRQYVKQSFYSFVEVDFYTKTLVVVKDLNDLTLDDFNLLMNEYYDLKKFRDYL
jgi:ribosomal protein S4